jgi:hypothetical protein
MKIKGYEKLEYHLQEGRTYRREELSSFSKAIDRHLAILVRTGLIEKLAGGIYYKPKYCKIGKLPPKDEDLIKTFLNDERFLLYSQNQYNSLGLGLTQLYNKALVYNNKRHGSFKIGQKVFDFRRHAWGFPANLSREFLLVDLLNNIDELMEDKDFVKNQIKANIAKYDLPQVELMATQYGKIGTKHFFRDLANDQ